MDDIKRLIEQATERCDSINTMCSDQRRATKEVLTKLVADALVVDTRAFANDSPPPKSILENAVIAEACEINKRLCQAIVLIDQTLRVPAAEYVPAIGEVFRIIDGLKVEYPAALGDGPSPSAAGVAAHFESP